MITHHSNRIILRIPFSRKVADIIIGMCAIVVVLVAIHAFLSTQPDFSLIITYLSDVRVTPVGPQFGLFPTMAP
jgi:hypothetical protein